MTPKQCFPSQLSGPIYFPLFCICQCNFNLYFLRKVAQSEGIITFFSSEISFGISKQYDRSVLWAKCLPNSSFTWPFDLLPRPQRNNRRKNLKVSDAFFQKKYVTMAAEVGFLLLIVSFDESFAGYWIFCNFVHSYCFIQTWTFWPTC